MRKCRAMQRKGKGRPTFYVESGQCPRLRQSDLQLKNMPSDQVCASVTSKSPNQVVHAAEYVENIESLQETASKIVDDNCAPQAVVYEDVSCEQLSDTLFRGMPPSSKMVIRNEDPNSFPVTDKYTFKQGKFHCSGCSFVCSRISSITTHVEEACKCLEHWQCLLCTESFHSKKALKAHHGAKHLGLEVVLESGGGTCSSKDDGSSDEIRGYENDDSENYQMKQMPVRLNSKKRTIAKKGNTLKAQCLACPVCPFTCYQERAMETHKKRGCLKSGEFQCASCSFRCKSPKALKHHKQLHKKLYCKRPQLSCSQCEFTCKQSRCLKQHVKIRHEGVKPHRCTYCDFSTTRRYRLEAHESMHTGVGRIACDVCSQTFGTNSKLRLHKLRVHEKKPTHFCTLCDYSGYNQNDITRHMSSCHNGELSFACSQCEAKFSSDTALKQHCLRKHEEKICLSCQHCLFVCHSDATLKCHMQKHHPHLECSTCNEMFDSREDLEDHRKSHFSHRCEFCNFASKERQQLVRHYLEAHESSASQERHLRCPFCDFSCQHQLVFDHHMKGHGGTRAYKCADCPYTTKNKQKITWHIRIHTGEKPYKCHLCIYACADPSRLKVLKPSMPSGFKSCSSCRHSFSGSDPHALCLECLGAEHRPQDCWQCDKLSSRALRNRLQRWKQIFGSSPPPEFQEILERRRVRGKKVTLPGGPPRPLTDRAQAVEGLVRPTPRKGPAHTGACTEGPQPFAEAHLEPVTSPDSLSEGTSVPFTGTFTEGPSSRHTGAVLCTEIPHFVTDAVEGFCPPVHQIQYRVSMASGGPSGFDGGQAPPPRGFSPSFPTGVGPVPPYTGSSDARFRMEACRIPDLTLQVLAARDAQQRAFPAPGPSHPPRDGSGEWQRDPRFTDDAPLPRREPSRPQTYEEAFQGLSHPPARNRFEPVWQPEPELLSNFTRLLTSDQSRSLMMGVMRETLGSFLPVYPQPLPQAPFGLPQGGGTPGGPQLPLVPPGRGPVLPPVPCGPGPHDIWPPLPPVSPPRAPTPPPLPQGEGEDSDEEEEHDVPPSMRAAHSLFREALRWMGVEMPQETSHSSAGVLASMHHPAPKTGIMLQPDVLEYVREIWERPHACLPMDKRVDVWHRLLPSETLCLASHPPAQSLVVAAAVKSPAASCSAPPGKEEKLWDTFGKKVYSNASLHLRQSNADAILASANNRLWEGIEKFSDLIPEADRDDFRDTISDAKRVADLQRTSAISQVDTAARAMCIAVDMRRQAWLRSTNLLQDAHDKVLDLPFDGRDLFSPETDALLEKCTTGAKTAKSLTPISKPVPKRAASPVPGGNKSQRRPSDGPGFRGFMKRQKGRDDKGSSSFRKQGKGSSSNTPRSSGSGKKD